MMLARVLADRLEQAKVAFTGAIRDGDASKFDPARAPALATTRTAIAVVMARANKHSLNMAAECMFLRAGGGSWAGSAKKMTDALTRTYGLPAASFNIADGSGYSRNNRVAPSAMTKLLGAVLERKDADAFVRSLPVSGTDGTMEDRLTAEPYKGRVLGKTGYIAGVSCLSGYVLGADGKPAYAFAIMTNGVSGPADAKTLQDSVAAALVDALPKK
jgi:D-alanyl-D-alanine carboxypeptidase/D-alanyl-D-alanine-endopeptidase (penicillin-binding protein 4)